MKNINTPFLHFRIPFLAAMAAVLFFSFSLPAEARPNRRGAAKKHAVSKAEGVRHRKNAEGRKRGKNITSAGRSVQRNEDGSVAVSRTLTNRRGNSRTIDKTIGKTEKGRAVSGAYSSGNGRSGNFSTSVERGEGVKTVTRSTTNSAGETARRVIETVRGEDEILRTITTTNRKGETTTRTQTRSKPSDNNDNLTPLPRPVSVFSEPQRRRALPSPERFSPK